MLCVHDLVSARRVFPGKPRLARGQRLSVLRCQAGKLSTDSVQQNKQKLAALAGRKYGHNLSDKQKQEIDGLVKQLESVASRQSRRPELGGSNWELLYTTSQGSSGGRVGPFIGKVDQVFPKEQPDKYVNKIKLGPLKADLTAEYKYAGSDRIDVSFIDIAAYLGPFRLLQKDFGGRGGYWKLTYHDDNLRILYTGQGNIFVLRRTA